VSASISVPKALAGCTVTLSGWHIPPYCVCGWQAEPRVVSIVGRQRLQAVRIDPLNSFRYG